VLFGGFKPAALERVARWGDGFLAAAAPSWAGGPFDTVRGFWQEYGREGEPRLVAQVNVALGPPDVLDDARARMHAYYAFTGMADRMVSGLLTTPAEIRAAALRLRRPGRRRGGALLLRPRPRPGGPLGRRALTRHRRHGSL
jgi:hypothetical protein